jgi:multidrug efflux pump subunit AcrB
MSTLFFRNPRLTALTIGLILVAGLSGLRALPRQEDPAMARRFASITTFYPGAGADRIESLVTEKIEARLQELHEVKDIESTSRTGVSAMKVVLHDRYGDDEVEEVWSKVRDKLADAQAELPAGAKAPEFQDQTSTAVTLVAALVWEGQGPPQRAVITRLARALEVRLRNLPGTEEVELFGEADEEIRVTVDPSSLASVDLTAREVAHAIARADTKLPAGQLRSGSNSLLLEVDGELTSLERIRSIPLRRGDDGRILRVGDIAEVTRTGVDPPLTLALIAGRPGVAIAATMATEQRVDLWAEAARAELSKFELEVPTGIGFRTIFDQSLYTEELLGGLVTNLLLGAASVLLVLVVMMGVRSALIVASALPLTIAMVLAELLWLGVPLHQMSITGLIIALGLLIDNAIVVVDEYDARVRRGVDALEAVRGAVRHLAVPLAASTLTTVLAFLPIVLMPGGAGEFVGPISIGVGLAVTSSFLLSLTVIPALAAYLSPRSSSGEGPWWKHGLSNARVTQWYRRSIEICVRRPAIGVAVSLVLPLLGFSVVGSLGQQFFPAVDRNQFPVQLVLAPQASIEETMRATKRARGIVNAHEDVVESHWFVGGPAPRVYYNMIGATDGMASFAGAFVTTRSAVATERLAPLLQRELRDAFPDARVIAVPFEQGPPFDAPIELRLVGPDLGVLRDLGEQLRAMLAKSRAVTYTTAVLEGGRPRLLLETDEDQAHLAGLSLADIADQLHSRLEGAEGGTVVEATEEIPVRVRVGDVDRGSLANIVAGRLLAPSRRGSGSSSTVPGVPLAALSSLTLVPELAGIPRRNGERVNTIQAYLEPFALISDSLADFQTRLDKSDFALPQGYRLEGGGEEEQRGEAMANLLAFALPLFVVMTGAVILSFNSFRLASIVFCVAFLAVGLAFLGVWLFGYPMGFVAIVGTMGLVGLAINGAIVVLSALRANPGASAADLDATVEVVIGATRHIVATTLTTVAGFLPLILFGGRFWPPMATAIAGGVFGSAILALYFAPALFAAIARRERGQLRAMASREDGEARAALPFGHRPIGEAPV